MKTELLNLIDFKKVDTLLEGFYKTTGFATAIIDLEGNVLAKSGWRQICAEFHRVNPETAQKCRISDTELANKMTEGEKYYSYKCLNGLVDVAAPVVIRGVHIANLFSGQLFLEEPDRKFFKKHAEKYGFDEKKYLKALEKVPVVSKDNVKVAFDFLLNMTRIISETTYQKLEQRELNKALKESEEMMRNSQSLAHICSYSTNLKEGELDNSSWACSPELYKIFGIDKTYAQTLEGWAGLIHPDYREEIAAYHEYVVKKRIIFNREFKIIRVDDGAERWVHGTGKLEFDEKENPVRIHGAIQDITDRKRAEMMRQIQNNIGKAVVTAKNLHELYDSIRNELNNIIDAKNIFIALYNKKTGMFNSIVDDEKDEISEWPAEKSLTGYLIRQNRPLLLRKNEILRLHKEGIIEIIGSVPEVWLGVPLKIEEKILGAIVVQNYHNPDVYDQPDIDFLELVAHELSIFIDWEYAEEKAVKLSRAVEQSSVSVVITNKGGYIEYVNPFFTKVTGYSIEEVVGEHSNIMRSEHHSKAFIEALRSTILSGNNWEGEMLNKKKNGDLYWEKVVVSPILNTKGVVTNFVAIKEDITERKKMLEELVAAKEKAQESDRLKTEFINNISHEIRTPLNGILGFGVFLSEPNLSPEGKKDMLAIVHQASNRLMNTVGNYIDMARIVSGTMEVHKNEFILQPFFEEVIERTKQMSAGKQISIELVSEPEYVDLTLNSDIELIRKILILLLDNALKFTENGSITCGYNLKDGFVVFYVKDTGKGITPKGLDSIFNLFTQEDSSDTRDYEGSGLGLSIVSGLVKLLGGSVSVTSELGKGSLFTFTVPYKEKEIAEKIAPAEKKNSVFAENPLVLLVEDEESNYLYMEVVLKLAGYDYLLAKNGEEAVARCKQHPNITLVLMDIKMPVMNGLEATRLIREFRPEIPIIATTAYAQTGDEEHFLAAGFNDYLAKPIRKEQLLALLKKY